MDNFFSLYHDYVKKTEPPPNFHAWSAIGAISALLGKKAIIPQGKFDVFPQLYIVLVGEPGTRKSTAMNIAKKIVRSVKGVPLASDSGSREGMMDEMAKNKIIGHINGRDVSYWQSAIFVDEIADLLGGEHIDQSMVRFLTTIWDQNLYRETTRKGGQVSINNPYLTLLGCTQPSWISNKLRQNVITDGLSRRTIFALEHTLNCLNPWPENNDNDFRLLEQLELEAKRIHSITGHFKVTTAARTIYDKAYFETIEAAKKFSPKVQTYFSSKHILALKLGMCISAGISSNRIIDSGMISAAFSFLRQSERTLDEVFAGVGRNELKSYADRLLQKIRLSKTGITKNEAIKLSYDDLNSVEINEVFDMLTNTKQIKTTPTSNVQGEPRFVAGEIVELPPAVDLMPLVRQLEPLTSETVVEIGVSSPIRHLDPATEQLLSHQAEYQLRTGSGLLLKGRKTQASAESRTP